MAPPKKRVTGFVKLQIKGGQANPSPPVGPALGQRGVNIMEFCKAFNARTEGQLGTVLPVVITVFHDKSFSFVVKTPPASVLLLKAAGIPSGAKVSGKEVVGKVSREKLREIATLKMPDLNALTVEAAENIIAGTAKNMGIVIE